MEKKDNFWTFAKAHPFITLWSIEAIVDGITRLFGKPRAPVTVNIGKKNEEKEEKDE